ncbi:hypothetical protein [Stenotrophomonas sp. HMWF003]|uniref:hypothetical protein n=1 Tax=Stenotrophomonas sp. HMWF003 TaxID=2056840 RepID=UPI000FE2064C|nr:hypothetical protein [Stenotrophomonas sp. HMWF003]
MARIGFELSGCTEQILAAVNTKIEAIPGVKSFRITQSIRDASVLIVDFGGDEKALTALLKQALTPLCVSVQGGKATILIPITRRTENLRWRKRQFRTGGG